MSATAVRRQVKPAAREHAPKWAPWIVLLAVPFAVLLELFSLAIAGAVLPLFDLALPLILLVALASRRWHGSSTKLFAVSAALAGGMMIEWVCWWGWWSLVGAKLTPYALAQAMPRFDTVAFYLAEAIALLVLFSAASVRSFVGYRMLTFKASVGGKSE